MDINKLITMAIEKGASDIHLNVGIKPIFRVDGKLKKVEELTSITAKEISNIFQQIVDLKQRDRFFSERELDFSHYFVSMPYGRNGKCCRQAERQSTSGNV